MFKTAERTELNQISLTGIRAIVLIGLLMVKPRSLEEIREAFIELQIMEESHSDDILRIDLNTIKIMGCEISRSSLKTNHKYVLSKHPFALSIPPEEIHVLKRVYNRVRQNIDLIALMEYDKLFRKIAFHICDEPSKEALLGVSHLRYYNVNVIKDLILDCKHNRTITLLYRKPGSAAETKKEIIAQYIVYKNDKIYLYGYDVEKEKSIVLNMRRVISILSRKLKKQTIEPGQTIVKFLLKDLQPEDLEKNEEIVDSTSGGYIIEGTYHNDFIAAQRILSLGSKCVVIEPVEFKNSIIEKIKEMRKTYEH